jgi:hypothetical protein
LHAVCSRYVQIAGITSRPSWIGESVPIGTVALARKTDQSVITVNPAPTRYQSGPRNTCCGGNPHRTQGATVLILRAAPPILRGEKQREEGEPEMAAKKRGRKQATVVPVGEDDGG